VPVDAAFRVDVDALEAAIAEDERAGHTGIAIVASAGTFATGAIDPLAHVAAIAREHGLWLHVDGAYGAPAALVEPGWFDGLTAADSISLDAHKWLYQPFDVSVLLYRDPVVAQRTFAYTDDYVRPTSTDEVEGLAFFEESIELSRRFRALKVWASLRYHGLERFREAIADDLRHARLLERLVEDEPSLELLAPVELSAVCFRWSDGSAAEQLDRKNAGLLRAVNARGRVALSNATVKGSFALRACFVNHRTMEKDVVAIVDEVLAAGRLPA
jgi:glutamate/tyrosine decarboxylase-like PLP-dependent enzyme